MRFLNTASVCVVLLLGCESSVLLKGGAGDGQDGLTPDVEAPTDEPTPEPENKPDPVDETDPPALPPCKIGEAPIGFPSSPIGTDVGSGIADFSSCLQDANGGEYNAYGYNGKVMLINLGAGWCGPCKAEAPSIEALYAQYAEQGFVVLMGLGEGWTRSAPADSVFLNEWIDAYKTTFPTFADPTFSLMQYSMPSQVNSIPQNIIVGRDGIILYNRAGSLDIAAARYVIEGAL